MILREKKETERHVISIFLKQLLSFFLLLKKTKLKSHEISHKNGFLQSPAAELKSPNTKRSNSSQGLFSLLACRHFKTPPRNPVVFAAIKRFHCQALGNGSLHPTVNQVFIQVTTIIPILLFFKAKLFNNLHTQ